MSHRAWLITCVNSGFGRQMIDQLLAREDRVAGTVRKLRAMNDLKEEYGDLLWLAYPDMSDPAEIRHVVNKAFLELGNVDVIVSNAGFGLFGAPESLTDRSIICTSLGLVGPL